MKPFRAFLLIAAAMFCTRMNAQYAVPSLLPEGPLTYHGPNGEVPIPLLYQAVLRKDAERVSALLTQGADANEMCPCGTPPLEAAAFQAKDARISELLLAHGADPNRRTPKNLYGSTNGWTPLFYAVYEKRADLVALLLKHRAKIDIVDIQGKTPLMLARERKDPDVIRELKDAGAKR